MQLADGPAVCAGHKWGVVWAALARRRPVSLVICWHLGMLRALPLLRIPRPRVALFLHGIEAWRRPGAITRRLLPRVDLFLANSAFTWRRFLEFNPECAGRPCRVVALGVGEPAADVSPNPGNPPAALLLARMLRAEDYKGHRELIAAWPQVQARLPSAQLWLAGDGDLRPELERLVADNGLAAAVRFFGRVSEEQKQALLTDCRCLAMPSRNEGFGLVYLEAMRLGRPCLVSQSDAGREVVAPPEAGLAVDPGAAKEMEGALSRLLTDSDEWRLWSAAARLRYESNFTAKDFGRRLTSALFDEEQAAP